MAYKTVLLMILDGWGLRTKEFANAVVQGNTPNYDQWNRTLERSVLDASGEAVGLVAEQMGNSEVGHLNLGAGRIVYQDISRIDNAIRDGSFNEHPLLVKAIERIKAQGKRLHLLGLMGSGGVHAIDRHEHALLRLAKQHSVRPIIHVITDGRDTPPNSGVGFLAELESFMAKESIEADFGTVSGRYYIMDRDKRWERSSRAYEALVRRQGETAPTAKAAIEASYAKDVTDEFVVPCVIGEQDLSIQAGDALVFFNFRADRMRQIVRLLTVREFENRPELGWVEDLDVISMTEYAEDLPTQILFPMEVVTNPLAEVLSKAGKKQFHIAETEKYAHVTYFFNGRREEIFPGEERALIPSPKVATYDLQPEMSAQEVMQTVLDRLASHDDDFILINFANPDMVGHTGSLNAAIKAVETVDRCAGKIVEALVKKGGVALVTADHGNCERMTDEYTGNPHTYHTTNPVTLHVIGTESYVSLRPRGILADVAPTVLDLLEIPQPPEMTGRSLIERPGTVIQ